MRRLELSDADYGRLEGFVRGELRRANAELAAAKKYGSYPAKGMARRQERVDLVFGLLEQVRTAETF